MNGHDQSADLVRIAESVEKAPSVFSTRPWLFRFSAADRIELRLPARLGSCAQADARQYAISGGAALFNLRLAIRRAWYDTAVWLLPDPVHDPALLASIEVITGRVKRPSAEEQKLYESIWRPHTDRSPSGLVPAPLPILVAMEDAAAQEGAWLRLLHPSAASRCVHLATRPGHRPQLMALSTEHDEPADWIRAGQALQRAILTATRYSPLAPYAPAAPRHFLTGHHDPARYRLSVSLPTQPLDRDDTGVRPRPWPWHWPFPELPQLVIRVGYAPDQRTTAARAGSGVPAARVLQPWVRPALQATLLSG